MGEKFSGIAWFGEYDGAEEKTRTDALAAQRMFETLQRMKHDKGGSTPAELADASVAQMQDAAAYAFIDGNTTYGELLGLDASAVVRIAEEAAQAVRTEQNQAWGEFFTGVEASNNRKVAGFVPYLRDFMADRYPDDKELAEDKVRRFAAAYVKDHGEPLFTADGKMKDFHFPGADDFEGDERYEYKMFSSNYSFGPYSESIKEMRFDRHVKAILTVQYIGTPEAEIDRKIREREYGESVTSTFEAKEKTRTDFMTFARDAIRKTTEILPLDRFGAFVGLMFEYDNIHSPNVKDPPPAREPSALYKTLTGRFAASQKKLPEPTESPDKPAKRGWRRW